MPSAFEARLPRVARSQQADGGGVELLGGDDVVHEAPVERRAGVDRVPGQGELQRPLLGDVARHGNQRRVAEPSTLAAGRGETRVLGRHRQVPVATSWQPAAVAKPCTRATTGWGMACIVSIELGARIEQLADRLGVGARQVPEVVAGGEDRTVGGEDHAPGVAVARGAEGRRHVTQQPERQRVAALRAVHRDRREALLGLHEHGSRSPRHPLERVRGYRLHETLISPRPTLARRGSGWIPKGGAMRSGNTIVVIRSVIAALFVALAVANFVGGRIVFGLLFAALAVMNVVMTVYVRRRRAQFAQRFPGFADRGRR